MSFQAKLAHGQLGESAIAKWCISRGNSVLPVYEKEIDTGKGPRFFTDQGQIVAPDMFLMPSMRWVEAKHKTVCSWYRIGGYWCTGIDLHHYSDYQRVQEISRQPVWLLFLHRSHTPDPKDVAFGCPPRCPVGLYGEALSHLVRNESHDSRNWGRHGMVYWNIETLRRLSTLDDFEATLAAFEQSLHQGRNPLNLAPRNGAHQVEERT